MSFQRDERYAAPSERVFGEYLTSYVSEPEGEIRPADIFRQPKRVVAYISFPTGRRMGHTTEPYVDELRNYASQEGFADLFKFIYADQ